MLIETGKVMVDGKVAQIGQRVESEQVRIMVKGKDVGERKYEYWQLHKPCGYVCSKRRQGATPTIYELLPRELKGLKTVGRLDKDSSGLILLTNDGDFAFRMTHPKFAKLKVYEVDLDRELEPLHQQMIGDFGVEIGDGRSRLGLTKIEEGNRKRWRRSGTNGIKGSCPLIWWRLQPTFCGKKTGTPAGLWWM